MNEILPEAMKGSKHEGYGYQLPVNSSIAALIEQLPPQKPNTVVGLNHRVVCGKRWNERQLQDGDRIVTFQMLGGG